MSDRIRKTIENHDKGYNCCQSVACAYCDLLDMDEATVFRMCEAFGLGMGNMDGTCGAISGAVVLAGLKNSSGDISNTTTKGGTYKLSKKILDAFKEANGSTICKELKGIETGKVLRTCPECIMDAAKLAEEILELN